MTLLRTPNFPPAVYPARGIAADSSDRGACSSFTIAKIAKQFSYIPVTTTLMKSSSLLCVLFKQLCDHDHKAISATPLTYDSMEEIDPNVVSTFLLFIPPE